MIQKASAPSAIAHLSQSNTVASSTRWLIFPPKSSYSNTSRLRSWVRLTFYSSDRIIKLQGMFGEPQVLVGDVFLEPSLTLLEFTSRLQRSLSATSLREVRRILMSG